MRIGRGQTGLLTVAFVGSALYPVLPWVLWDFRQQSPKVDVSLTETLAPDTAGGLQERKMDVGIVRPALLTLDEFEQRPLVAEKMVVAVPEGHPVRHETTLALASVHGAPLILFPIHPKPSLTEVILNACDAVGAEPDIVQNVLHLQTALILDPAGCSRTGRYIRQTLLPSFEELPSTNCNKGSKQSPLGGTARQCRPHL
nr:LysR family substrate-binding domain-containing protein [Roseobacter insulae]